MPPRYQSTLLSFEEKLRNLADLGGQPGHRGHARIGGGIGRGSGLAQSLITNTGPDAAAAASGQLLLLSATGVSIASGGDYVTFDTEVYRHGFDGFYVDAETILWPSTFAGASIQVELAWDTYENGGTVEIEVDGLVPDWGMVGSATSGQQGCKRRGVHITAGQQVRIKVTQVSGAAQAANVLVECSLADPTEAGERFLLPFQSAGWKYKLVAADDVTDYSDPALDDSAWTVGTATFGAAVGVTPTHPITTTTNVTGRTWLRRTFTGRFSEATVTVLHDGTGEAWWNGVLLGSAAWSGVGPGLDEHEFEVPASALGGHDTHVLAVRVSDDLAADTGDQHYADAKVRAVRG